MTAPPDEIAWVPQKKVLTLAGISRTTLNSWIKSGLDIPEDTAAYRLPDLVMILVFAGARKYLNPKDMVSAWGELVPSGEAARITNIARGLKVGDRFDLVVDPEYLVLRIVCSDEELVAAVRHPTAPRPVIVVDLAERVRDAVGAFHRAASSEAPPRARKRGRPRNANRRLRVVGEGDRP